ncbi:MAG: hypothetical protein Q8N10_17130 [Phenylobacterium sp.]|uniref:hypothetical protein n=1 Tax=Phenylobacterium sp. TaxID=1871053 RepID=UPI0027246CDA|nr:hypothetical protein [Phenylobacterium sp.]MDO8911798.1 hypothetical protein [Phenylobacterium sp.]MDP3102212.1 hypothetical protein [Phenylobacterium sp.]
MTTELIEAYAQMYLDAGASHELTISLGVHPKKFDPETEFLPQMRRVVREIAHMLRGIPKRRMLKLPLCDAPWMAGFYEATDAAGILFPHWHGVIALHDHEESRLRAILVNSVGKDMTPGAAPYGRTTRPIITTLKAKPTFHLAPLESPDRWIAYSAKKVWDSNPVHWVTGDFLPST